MTQSVDGPRARYRQQVRDEVQTRAWTQISLDGVSALSLKAIATAMGLTAPALYRYYKSRDELLTELIVSAYADLAELVEAAALRSDTSAGRLSAIGNALREWAVEHPQRYLLLYGTPVPGYHAPDTATALAQRIFAPIMAGFDEEPGAGGLPRSLTWWTRLHGVLSLELAGHFIGMKVDPAQHFQAELRSAINIAG